MSETCQSPRSIIYSKEFRIQLSANPKKRHVAYLVSGNKVPDKEEDGHDDVLSNGDDIRARDFQHLDALLDGSVEVDVVRADTSRDAELQVLGLPRKQKTFTSPVSADKDYNSSYLFKEVSCEVSGVEWCSDQDLSLKNRR